MAFRVRHGRSARGLWAIAVRMLALVLALSLAGPGVGLAADLAFHAGGHQDRSVGPSIEAAGSAVDPGVTEHLHCGCHQAAPLEAAIAPPPAIPGRPVAVRIVRALPSVIPDRLPRPPRA
ncbi:hypothetical protein MKL09_12030 [Methylobacterium sp. J-048]|uniref:hypothetical protein n=1 Tax=Methylobacterium sp. J-048 TaxID=2836635 RepID=UPI001FB953AE|nr:hypothetical protein [Methylobacterium sp. J-048]MCJ2057282.1 hypothetical protein [Methylobacterium sp. J-048]